MYILSDVGIINVNDEDITKLSLTDKYEEIFEGTLYTMIGFDSLSASKK